MDIVKGKGREMVLVKRKVMVYVSRQDRGYKFLKRKHLPSFTQSADTTVNLNKVLRIATNKRTVTNADIYIQ